MKKRKVRLLGSCPEHGATVLDEDNERIGLLTPVHDGESLNGCEVVSLSKACNDDGTHDLTTLYDGTSTSDDTAAPAPSHKGPAHVTTRAYRDSWDRVFGKDTAN